MNWAEKTAPGSSIAELRASVLNELIVHHSEDFQLAYESLVEGASVRNEWLRQARMAIQTLKDKGIGDPKTLLKSIHSPLYLASEKLKKCKPPTDGFSEAIDALLEKNKLAASTIPEEQRLALDNYFTLDNLMQRYFSVAIQYRSNLGANEAAARECREALVTQLSSAFGGNKNVAHGRVDGFDKEIDAFNIGEKKQELWRGCASDWIKDHYNDINTLLISAKIGIPSDKRGDPDLIDFIREVVKEEMLEPPEKPKSRGLAHLLSKPSHTTPNKSFFDASARAGTAVGRQSRDRLEDALREIVAREINTGLAGMGAAG